MNNILDKVIERALNLGATDVDAVIAESKNSAAEVRLGNVTTINSSESAYLGLRILINQQQAIVSTSDFSEKSLEQSIQRCIAMAKVTPANPHLRLATANEYVKYTTNLNLYDNTQVSAQELIEKAKETEALALENKLISNSQGANAGFNSSRMHFVTSKGFSQSYEVSSHSLSLILIAGKDEAMQTDYAYSRARFASDLKTPKEISNEAVRRVTEKLNPKKIKTTEMPVIFERRAASSIIGSLIGAINGFAISRKTSMLLDSIGKNIFKPSIQIVDDPFILKGLGSRPFDGEGIAGNKLNIIENGVLQHYLLDLQTADKLNLPNNGRALRSFSSAPSPSFTNFYMKAGDIPFEDMVKSINKGLLITDVFGHGANIISGDYSQGASGFYIENGAIAYPVNEITIASNLKQIFLMLVPASDLILDSSVSSPSLLIERMTIAGV